MKHYIRKPVTYRATVKPVTRHTAVKPATHRITIKPVTRHTAVKPYSRRVSNTGIRVNLSRFSQMLANIESQSQQLLAQQEELKRNQSLIAYDRKVYYVYVAMMLIGAIVIFDLFG